ncbi:MAG: hypothetical protein ACREQ8_14895 [Woeseiaceae bacterium]
MTTPVTDKAAFRIRSYNDSTKKSKGYVRSYELLDEQSQRTQVRCDLFGNAALKSQEILAGDGKCWTLEPNRKFMPGQWTLMDTSGRRGWQFHHKMWGKFVNPLQKALIAVLDPDGRESLRLVDLHTAKLPVLLGLEWGKYALVKDDEPVATFTRLPRGDSPGGGGIKGAVRRFLTSSDEALVSADSAHPLPAHAALALYLLYRNFTDVSGAG